jgi:hypothetical protein
VPSRKVIEQEHLDRTVRVRAMVASGDDLVVPDPIRTIPDADPESAIPEIGRLGRGQIGRGKAVDQAPELSRLPVVEFPGRIGRPLNRSSSTRATTVS